MKKGSWGGKREGAGRKPGWKHGPCKAVKIPVSLEDDVLRYAHQLDAGQAPAPTKKLAKPSALQVLREELLGLPAEDQARQLAEHLQAIEELQRELDRGAPVPAAPPVASETTTARLPSSDAPRWLAPIRKKISSMPKRSTRLMVLRLLFNHQEYIAERLHDHERRPPDGDASARMRSQWEQRREAYRQKIRELDLLFSDFPSELIAEARAIRPNWGGRETVGARRSYDAILARINGEPRVSKE